MMKRIAGLLRSSRSIAPALVAGFLLAGGDAQAQNCSGSPNQNTLCAGPTIGGSGFPSFRSMVNGDIPAGTVTGSSIASGTVTGSNIASGTVANSNLANMAAGFKGSSGGGAPTDLTAAQALQVLKTQPWPDTSEVVANGAAKWNPLFFANAGTGIVHRFNRIFVGEAALGSSDFGPVTTKDWLETLVPNTLAASMFISVDTTGNLGVTGASRCSDFRTVFGSSSGGCQGGTFYGYNDDTAGGAIGCGVCGTGIRKAGATGDTVNQFDIINGGSLVDVTPFAGVTAGSTIAGLMTAGAVSGLAANNASVGWAIGAGLTTKFQKGGICFDGALNTAVGAGGDGVCVEMARNMSIRWLNSGGTTDGEITANANGIQFPTDQAWTTYTAIPTCGSATITTNSARRKTLGKTTFVELDINITALGTCTTALSFTLPNTPQSGAGLVGRAPSNGVGVFCQIQSATTGAGCSGTGNFATGQVVLSGVYENQ